MLKMRRGRIVQKALFVNPVNTGIRNLTGLLWLVLSTYDHSFEFEKTSAILLKTGLIAAIIRGCGSAFTRKRSGVRIPYRPLVGPQRAASLGTRPNDRRFQPHIAGLLPTVASKCRQLLCRNLRSRPRVRRNLRSFGGVARSGKIGTTREAPPE